MILEQLPIGLLSTTLGDDLRELRANKLKPSIRKQERRRRSKRLTGIVTLVSGSNKGLVGSSL